MVAVADFFPMTGPAGNAVCSRTLIGVSCMIRLQPLQLDADSVRHSLEIKYAADPAQLNRKLLVAGCFEREPIGIITITFDH